MEIGLLWWIQYIGLYLPKYAHDMLYFIIEMQPLLCRFWFRKYKNICAVAIISQHWICKELKSIFFKGKGPFCPELSILWLLMTWEWKMPGTNYHGHYNDVIMNAMVSQITGISIVYSTVCSGADQRKHQCSASLAFVRWIHRWPVDSPHKGPVTWEIFPFDDVIMALGIDLVIRDNSIFSPRTIRNTF